MANRALLLTSNEKTFDFENYNESEDIIAAGSYCIPLFWFSLFSIEDIGYTDVEMDDGEVQKCPSLVVEVNIAKDRILDRESSIFNIVPAKYKPLYQRWNDFICGLDSLFIHIEMTEIWGMSDNSEVYESNLRNSLDSMENLSGPKGSILLKEFAGIEIRKGIFDSKIISPKSEDEIISLLCGYSWIKEVPWESF